MPRILIIEDEAMLRSTMIRGLSKLPDIEVSDAGTLADALHEIDADPPQLILSDLDLPDRSGVELLGEIERRKLEIPVVFITAFLKSYQPQIPSHANVEVHEKPVSLGELRHIVLKHVGKEKRPSEITPFRVSEYIQLSCIGRHSVVIGVEHEGNPIGKIVVMTGDVWSASDREGVGLDAFYRLVRCSKNRVVCQALQGKPGERNIEESWEALLMEGARQEDEKSRCDSEPDSEVKQNIQFQNASERGLDALLIKDYAKALSAFLEAEEICPGNKGIKANIHRLREMGYENGQKEEKND
ncbi:MAG: response regulator [Nitrospiria bacterium]